MPELTRFYGIIIKMFFNDHWPPHFHAQYGEYAGMFTLTGEPIEGDIPQRAQNLITEWAHQHTDELTELWTTQTFRKLPPLE